MSKISTGAFGLVFAFCGRQWRRQPVIIPSMSAAMLVATVLDAVIPVFAGRLVDALALDRGGREAATRAVFAIFGLAMTMVAFRWVAFSLLIRSTSTIMKRIVEEAFFRVQRFSTDWHGSSFAGATVRKVTRGMWAYDQLADTLLFGFLPALVMLVSVTVLLALRWTIMGALVALGSVSFILVAVTFALRYVAPMATLANEADSKLGAALADAVGCNAVVKSFAGERREDARLGETTELWRGRIVRTWRRGTLSGNAQTGMTATLQAIVLVLAVWLWSKGRATPGDVAFVLATYTVIQGYLREMSMHVRDLQRAINDMEDVAKFARQPLGIEDRPDAKPLARGPGAIALDRVSFRYGGQGDALYEDFSLTIAAGERVGLVGHSGSGKSTFVKLIQRLYDLEGGQIRIDGQNIAALTQESLRGAIAVVPQEPLLFHRSLAENIAYGRPGARREDIMAAAVTAHAHDFIAALPQGYDTLVGERGVKLSGGERQRVALARAVVADAEILVFDEATSSLDSVSEALMQDALESVIGERTTIIIAHRLSTVQKVDRILVFDRGRIVEQGTHAELLRREDSQYRRLFEIQALGLTQGAAVIAA